MFEGRSELGSISVHETSTKKPKSKDRRPALHKGDLQSILCEDQSAWDQVSDEAHREIMFSDRIQDMSAHQPPTHKSTSTKASPSNCHVDISEIDATIATHENEPSS